MTVGSRGAGARLGISLPSKLQLDQLSQRVLVAILELARIERALLGLDDVDGEIEHLSGNRLRRNLRERLLGRTHLVIVVQHRGGETLVESADENSPSAPKQDGFRDRRHFGLAHALAHQRESFVGASIRGGEVIGLVEIEIVDPGQIDERGNGKRLVAMRNDRGDFIGLDRDVFVLRDFVALDLIVPLDGLAGLGVDELASNPMAGRPIDRMQGDAFRGRSGGVKADRDRHVGDLQKAFPACSRRQCRPREVLRAA